MLRQTVGRFVKFLSTEASPAVSAPAALIAGTLGTTLAVNWTTSAYMTSSLQKLMEARFEAANQQTRGLEKLMEGRFEGIERRIEVLDRSMHMVLEAVLKERKQ